MTGWQALKERLSEDVLRMSHSQLTRTGILQIPEAVIELEQRAPLTLVWSRLSSLHLQPQSQRVPHHGTRAAS